MSQFLYAALAGTLYVEQAGLELAEISYLCLPNVGITEICHHIWTINDAFLITFHTEDTL